MPVAVVPIVEVGLQSLLSIILKSHKMDYQKFQNVKWSILIASNNAFIKVEHNSISYIVI